MPVFAISICCTCIKIGQVLILYDCMYVLWRQVTFFISWVFNIIKETLSFVSIYCRKSVKLFYCTTFNLDTTFIHPSITLCWSWNGGRKDAPSKHSSFYSLHSECQVCFRNNCLCLLAVETIWNSIFIAIIYWSISVHNMHLHRFQ
jgi:hypothetical protein